MSESNEIQDRQMAKCHQSYRKVHLDSVQQLLIFQKLVRQKIANVTVPVLVIHSRHDTDSSLKNAEMIINGVSSTFKKKIILERGSHNLLVDLERIKAFNATINFFKYFSSLHYKSFNKII